MIKFCQTKLYVKENIHLFQESNQTKRVTKVSHIVKANIDIFA